MKTRPAGRRAGRARSAHEEPAAIGILRTADLVRRHLGVVVERHGVTLQQYNVLRILRGVHPQPLPTLDIGGRLIERVPGITRLLDRLEEKRLVQRTRGADDRRVVHCRITPKGLELLAGMDAEVDAADRFPVQGMPAREVRTLVRLLARVRARLER